MAHVSQFKKDVVANLIKLISENPIIGAVNMEDLPASAVQNMRAKLRGKAEIIMTKRRLMKIAFEEAEKTNQGVSALVEHLKGMPALLFTKENPFRIYKIIKQSKSAAHAKAGQIAPKDIEVKAGATPFLPGPVIGELGALGIKSGVENGKVAIQEDKVVVKEGEEISQNAAGILARLDIKPMELGLDIPAMYEAGVIYDRKVLDIDEDKFLADLTQAGAWARNLAVDISYPTKDTIELLLIKAHKNTKAIALEANILADGVKEDVLAKAERQMKSLKSTANIPAAPAKEKPKPEEKPAEEKKEEPKAEETPKEEKAEGPKKEEPPKEEKPAEQPKSDEPKEEKKEEQPKEEKPVEEPKPEEKKEENPNQAEQSAQNNN